eukprot:TRINITY_DN7420_c0_g4_i2.p1 TRINITY_DN7420_c0_g4~~TRINITY_DN7420_c0_g4_i2.p1  ORF type:complete len:523 (-),score=68.23 TRINITY_DN7420_c0_g4_i2:1004-2470(-)
MLCCASINHPKLNRFHQKSVKTPSTQSPLNPRITVLVNNKRGSFKVKARGSVEQIVLERETLPQQISNKSFTLTDVAKHNQPDDCWIIVNDKVYDVTEFVQKHPGGKIIQEYAGRDASEVFGTFHSKQAWQQLSEFYIGQLQNSSEQTIMQQDYQKLYRKFKKDGLFKSNIIYYALKIASNQSILGAAVLALFYAPGIIGTWPATFLATCLTALFWQQSGWLTHDFLHHQVFPEHRYAGNWMGYMLGSLFQGFSAGWWKNKHNVHHALPNYIHDEHFTAIDPDINTLPLLSWSKQQLTNSPLENLLVKLQYFTFIPILLIARVAWCVESFFFAVDLALQKQEYAELICICMHYVLFFGLAFGTLPTAQALTYLLGANFLGGLFLGVVFVISHNGMDIISDRDENFASAQILTTRNIQSSVFVDWFTGGLNFQIEHHLFPTMPRHNLPVVQKQVKELCERNGLEYENLSFGKGFESVMETLDEVAQHAH